MNQCKDSTKRLSRKVLVCTRRRLVRVGVSPRACGLRCRRSCRSTANPAQAGGHGWNSDKWPTASSMSCGPAASGKPLPRSSVPAVRCTATSRNGRGATSSTSCGSTCCDVTTRCGESNGSGKALMAPAPRRRWAGKKTGKNPTDRGKLGVKRSVLTDGRGVPIGLAVAGANRHDQKLFHATLDSLPVRRPRPTANRPQHLCCDKGYDADLLRREARRRRYRPHIKSRGEEKAEKRHRRGRARRWVVERIASWMNRFRRILVRWEKKAQNYEALLHLTLAYITWKRT